MLETEGTRAASRARACASAIAAYVRLYSCIYLQYALRYSMLDPARRRTNVHEFVSLAVAEHTLFYSRLCCYPHDLPLPRGGVPSAQQSRDRLL